MSENGTNETTKEEKNKNKVDVTAPANSFGGLRLELGAPVVDNRNSPEVLAAIDAHRTNGNALTSGMALKFTTGIHSQSSVNHEPTF